MISWVVPATEVSSVFAQHSRSSRAAVAQRTGRNTTTAPQRSRIAVLQARGLSPSRVRHTTAAVGTFHVREVRVW